MSDRASRSDLKTLEAKRLSVSQASPALAGQADFGGVLPKDTPKVWFSPHTANAVVYNILYDGWCFSAGDSHLPDSHMQLFN